MKHFFIETDAKSNEDVEDILYFGWFLDESTASSLERIAKSYLTQAIDEEQEISYFIGNVSENKNVSDPAEYFVKPLDPNTQEYDPYFHVTAMFCGNNISCSNYYDKVRSSLGQTFETQIIGFYFTERTFGARILLSEEQEELFDVEETSRSRKSFKKHAKLIKDANYPGITFVPQDLNFHPTSSRAHLTLGCAPEVQAVVTGLDLLEIVEYEININETFYKDYILSEIGTLRQYGENDTSAMSFVLYPKYKMLVNATFEAYFTSSSPRIIVACSLFSVILFIVTLRV